MYIFLQLVPQKVAQEQRVLIASHVPCQSWCLCFWSRPLEKATLTSKTVNPAKRSIGSLRVRKFKTERYQA